VTVAQVLGYTPEALMLILSSGIDVGTERELREQIVEFGRLMYWKGWIAANDGNISVRLSPDRILATPTKVSKGMMRAEDAILCDHSGVKVSGNRECTSEIEMHVTIYSVRPDVRAIVHAHPPVATGFALAGRALDHALLPEVVINLGSIPLAPYGLPGTPELSERLRPLISDHDAILMANHGVVCYGADLATAFFNLETVEHCARIALVAEVLGGPQPLPVEEVDRLVAARSRYGLPSERCMSRPKSTIPRNGQPNGDKATYTRGEVISLIDEILCDRLRSGVPTCNGDSS